MKLTLNKTHTQSSIFDDLLGVTFGDGKYGNLGNMVAAILLDDESRSVTLDSDPTGGGLIEPIQKLIGFMRAMEYKPDQRSLEVVS